MSKLRLGAILDDKPVKITLELSGALARDLADYARVHARASDLAEPLAPEKLIPAMVERFMGGDREFAKQRRRSNP